MFKEIVIKNHLFFCKETFHWVNIIKLNTKFRICLHKMFYLEHPVLKVVKLLQVKTK